LPYVIVFYTKSRKKSNNYIDIAVSFIYTIVYVMKELMAMKNRFYIPAILAFALFAIGCPSDPDPGRTDPAFLLGDWQNDIAFFRITEGSDAAGYMYFNFESDLEDVTGSGDPGIVRGRLVPIFGRSPDEFRLRDMTTGHPETGALDYPDESFTSGNQALRLALPGFPNLLVFLPPNAARSQFTFRAQNPIAQDFFAGDTPFVSVPRPD